jgi:glycosyltransferase involved in cell wall biosynthesis
VTEPLVSVIIPTRNSARFVERCLTSVRRQTYSNIEVLVVDNHSTDKTRELALRLADQVLLHGPERSAQVNYGVLHAAGDYVYRVDSDFVLDADVIRQCVDCARQGFDAVVVHNTPDESVSWLARIRKLEIDMYKYDLDHSSARFFRKDVFLAIGCFDERITAGEDYDLQNRLNRAGYRTGFVDAEAVHLGEPQSFWPHMRAYYEYGKDFRRYRERNPTESRRQLAFVRRVYVKNWRRFAARPGTTALFVAYHCSKFLSAAVGYVRVRLFG